MCLDSGCGNYDQLWLTTSLRGLTRRHADGARAGRGRAFRRRLRHRAVELPHPAAVAVARSKTRRAARSVRRSCTRRSRPSASRRPAARPRRWARTVYTKFPFAPGMADGRRSHRAGAEPHLAAGSWRVIGIDGLAEPGDAGNVLLPFTAAKLSLRLPPTLDAERQARCSSTPARSRPALWREGDLQARARVPRAGMRRRWRRGSQLAGAGLAGGLRRPARLYGRRRHDPVHGHAGREIPAGAVRHHRRARTRIPTRTARTNSCTSRPASASPRAPRCWRTITPGRRQDKAEPFPPF